jgi:hypothetical protein
VTLLHGGIKAREVSPPEHFCALGPVSLREQSDDRTIVCRHFAAVEIAHRAPGRADLLMRPATFSVREVAALTQAYAHEIATVRAERRAAFDAERMRWAA